MSTSKTQNYSFEEAMQVLDASLAALSQGDLPLEKAIEEYKQGLDMVALCQNKLQTAESDIKVLQQGLEKAFEIEGLE